MYVAQSYTFNPGPAGQGTIEVDGSFRLEDFGTIVNVTRNSVIYDPVGDDAGASLTSSGGVSTLTLRQTTSYCEPTDKLQIIIIGSSGGATEATLQNVDNKLPDLVDGKIPVDIGSNIDVTIDNTSIEVSNDDGNPIPTVPVGVIDTGNGFSGVMTGGQTFTGTGFEASPKYGTISVCVFSSHASATNGLRFQASIDNINWETIEDYTYNSPNTLETYSFAPSGRYFRLTYTNGATATSKTAIFTVLRTGYTKSSSHRIGDTISAEKDAELVKAVLAAQKPNGTFTDINATAGGNLKVSVEEVEGSLPVSGTVNTLTGLEIPPHDYVSLGYTGDNLTTVVYKDGGASGTVVATLTLSYTGSRLDSVTRS